MTLDTTKGGASAPPRFLVRWGRSKGGAVTSLYVRDRLTGETVMLDRENDDDDMDFRAILKGALEMERRGGGDDADLPYGESVVGFMRADCWLSTSPTDDDDDPGREIGPDEVDVQDEGS